jgi:hypothetical protein
MQGTVILSLTRNAAGKTNSVTMVAGGVVRTFDSMVDAILEAKKLTGQTPKVIAR